MLIGVYGTNERLENTPSSPEGVLLPAPKGRAAELLAQKHGKELGIPIIPIHRAVLTTHQNYKDFPARLHPGNVWAQKIVQTAMAERSACFWATPCGRGCQVGANYQSTTVHLPPALATGNLDIIPNAHCREVIVGPDGKAKGVLFIDKKTGKEATVSGKAVILAAGACETCARAAATCSRRTVTTTRSNGAPGAPPAMASAGVRSRQGGRRSRWTKPRCKPASASHSRTRSRSSRPVRSCNACGRLPAPSWSPWTVSTARSISVCGRTVVAATPRSPET